MVEYLLLATFVTVLATLAVWFVRTVKLVSTACYQAFLPSSKGSFRQHIKRIREERDLPHLSKDLEQIPQPWGWRSRARRAEPIEQRPVAAGVTVVPWGWPGHSMNGDHRVQEILEHLNLKFEAPLANALNHATSQAVGGGEADQEAMNIRRTHSGGFRLVRANSLPLSKTRAPWGW